MTSRVAPNTFSAVFISVPYRAALVTMQCAVNARVIAAHCLDLDETIPRPMTTILLADDHEVVRWGLRMLLEAQPGWQVIVEVSDGKEAIAKAAETRPDVVILDYSLPL